MKYLLDTSVISELISNRPNPDVVDFIDSLDQESIYLSAITVGEVAKAIQKLTNAQRKQKLEKWLRDDLLVRFKGNVIALDADIFMRWGELSARLEGIGVEHPAIDSLIAATVLTHQMVLVTINESDFENMEIEIVNPW
ncbi:MAG: type II toxin-antitoxin system VapC family toxin [Chloroflexi bacterium]|nr:type II toxin-antitoxin system VapC family toxin [Chloroflexota bacterium]MBI3170028.1 type II toxin-antitoxin system VapC family toxin [Chloroflexota bacterium]